MLQRIALFMAVGLLLGCSSQEIVDTDKVIENVHLISMEDEKIQRDRSVLIKDDRIQQIVAAGEVTVSDSVEHIDGNGGYLIPGLSEMHAHIPSGDADRKYIDDVLFLYLANGITTIRGMLGDPLHLELRQQAAQGDFLSPRIYTSGPGFGGNIESTDQARQRVRDQHEAGYDFLKIFPGPTLEEYNALADEANSVGIEFSGHIPPTVGLERALEAGQTTIDHLDKYVAALVTDSSSIQDVEDPGVIYFGMHLTPYIDRNRIQEVAQMTAEAGTWNVPTQALLEHVLGPESAEELANRPEFQYMPDETVNNWINSKKSITGHEGYTIKQVEQYLQLRRDIIKALHEADAGLLLGSDAPQIFNVPGFSVHHELRYIVEAGLTPYEALRTGTINPAEYFGETQDRGALAEGKVADMVLLEENPLEEISNSSSITGVMYRGNWLSKEEIDKRLAEIAAKYE